MRTALAIAAFVIPLGFDTFAVSVALGLRGVRPLRPALVFAAFEVTMPLAGIALGRYVGARVESLAGYLGGLIVIALGIHTLREATENDDAVASFSLRGVREMFTAGLGISSDEIAIGFPLGALRLPLGPVLGAIGVQAFVAAAGGILLGHRIGRRLGLRTARLAGVIAGTAFVALGAFLIAEQIVRR